MIELDALEPGAEVQVLVVGRGWVRCTVDRVVWRGARTGRQAKELWFDVSGPDGWPKGLILAHTLGVRAPQ